MPNIKTMANDRFRTRYSSRLEALKQVESESRYVHTSPQPIRKYDERFSSGKYRGKKVSEVPTSYLNWVLANWKGLTKDQENLIRKFL